MTVRIPLTRGKSALVDDDDAVLVGQFKWNARPNRNGMVWYAARTVWVPEGQRFLTQRMHSLITGFAQTDHINGNGLDNRRCNLREATRAENQRNQWKTHGSSRYKGVSLNRGKGKPWHAQLGIGGRVLHLGLYDEEGDAARVYDAAARKLFGAFAAVNFPLDGERSALADVQSLGSAELPEMSRPGHRKGPWPKRRPRGSCFKGVYWEKRRGRWIVQIERRYVGIFTDEQEAARSYDKAAREAFGSRALLNFPGPGEKNAFGEPAVGDQALHYACLWVAALLVVLL